MSDYDIEVNYEGVSGLSTSDGQILFGLKPRMGIEYSIDESIMIYSEASAGFYKMRGSQLSNYKDFGLGITYFFN
jgi:hypothetical protein